MSKRPRILIILAAALMAFVLGTNTAQAQIWWGSTSIWNVHYSSQCIYSTNYALKYDQSCNGTWSLGSIYPDVNGHAQVRLMTLDRGNNTYECLSSSFWAGPSQINGSRFVGMLPCDGSPEQEWQMTTAYPANSWNHYITFYNPRYNVCLDGGIGVYGFPGGCNSGNNYQVWDVVVYN